MERPIRGHSQGMECSVCEPTQEASVKNRSWGSCFWKTQGAEEEILAL